MTAKLKKAIIMPMNKNGFAITGILVAIVIALAGAVVYISLSKNQETSPPETISSPPITPQPTSTPPTAQELPVGWKIYQNQQYGFEVSYPTDKFLPARAGRAVHDIGGDITLSTFGLIPTEVAGRTGETCIHAESGNSVPCDTLYTNYISFRVLSFPFAEFRDAQRKLPPSCQLPPNQFNLSSSISDVFCEELGVEGDNISIYYMPLGNRTLQVSWGHRSSNYPPGNPIFTEQAKVFKDVMATLRFL